MLLGTEAPQIVDPAYLVSTQPLQKSTSDANFKATVGTDIGAVTALKDIKINAEHEAVQGGSYVWAKDGQNQGLCLRD